MRADGGQDARCPHDPEQPEQADHDEPHQHHRAEDVADEIGPLALDQEQTDQDRDGDGNDHRRERGRVDLETFDGAEHRDRRRDHAVAVEQRGADQADDEQRGAPAPARRVPGVKQREQRDDAALAVIVGAQDQNGVFERDDQDDRPEDHRHDAHHGFGRGCPAGLDGLLQPIERAGADIAVDNAECGKRHNNGPFTRSLVGQHGGLKGIGHRSVLPSVVQFGTKKAPTRSAGQLISRCFTQRNAHHRGRIEKAPTTACGPNYPRRCAQDARGETNSLSNSSIFSD